MALFYVTGAPGAGKTTLQKALSERGFDTRDIDNSDFGGPHNKSTGERVVIPPADERAPKWFEAHEWRIYPQAFEKLKAEVAEKDIILCGVAAADVEILHLFDEILYLRLSDEALRDRLRSRTGNDYGKNAFELEEIIGRKHGLDARYASTGVVIDASKTPEEVVGDIISHVRSYHRQSSRG